MARNKFLPFLGNNTRTQKRNWERMLQIANGASPYTLERLSEKLAQLADIVAPYGNDARNLLKERRPWEVDVRVVETVRDRTPKVDVWAVETRANYQAKSTGTRANRFTRTEILFSGLNPNLFQLERGLNRVMATGNIELQNRFISKGFALMNMVMRDGHPVDQVIFKCAALAPAVELDLRKQIARDAALKDKKQAKSEELARTKVFHKAASDSFKGSKTDDCPDGDPDLKAALVTLAKKKAGLEGAVERMKLNQKQTAAVNREVALKWADKDHPRHSKSRLEDWDREDWAAEAKFHGVKLEKDDDAKVVEAKVRAKDGGWKRDRIRGWGE
jgi:hypothetical protein